MPIDDPLHGDEFAFRSSVRQCSEHIARVARLIKANVPEVDEHERRSVMLTLHQLNLQVSPETWPPRTQLTAWSVPLPSPYGRVAHAPPTRRHLLVFWVSLPIATTTDVPQARVENWVAKGTAHPIEREHETGHFRDTSCRLLA